MAKEYAEAGYVHCEADQHFETDGEYRYDPSKLRAAHDDCLRRSIGAFLVLTLWRQTCPKYV
jgi:hypothetical protein